MTRTQQETVAELIEMGRRRGFDVRSPSMAQAIVAAREARQQASREAQRMGRAVRGRVVHTQRARKLRRRGEAVIRIQQTTSTGKAIYLWMKRPPIIDYRSEMLNATREWTLDVPAGAGKGAPA